MAGRVRVRGRDGSSNPIPVPVPDFWLSGKTWTRTHTRSTRILPVKVGTDSGGYPQVRVFLPCLNHIEGDSLWSHNVEKEVYLKQKKRKKSKSYGVTEWLKGRVRSHNNNYNWQQNYLPVYSKKMVLYHVPRYQFYKFYHYKFIIYNYIQLDV